MRRLADSRFFSFSEVLRFPGFNWRVFAVSSPGMLQLEELELLKKSLGEEAGPPAEL